MLAQIDDECGAIMTDSPSASHAYLLRLWLAGSSGTHICRASVVNEQTGERRRFADLASLFTFLEGQTDSHQRPDDGTSFTKL